MKYFLLPFGCQMNSSDTERIAAVLDAMGLERTDNEDEAMLRGMVACSVRQRPIDRVYGRIYKWNKEKTSRPLLTFLTGCVLDEDEKKFLKLFDFMFRMPDLPGLPDMIRQYGVSVPALSLPQGSSDTDTTAFWKISPDYASTFQAFVPIQNGCDKFCTYCAVPYTRGREVSRPAAAILEEIHTLLERGYKSITLLGQNVNSYGLDTGGAEPAFAVLLEEIASMIEARSAETLVYFTSPHPSDMDTGVFSVIAAHPCLARQIHLPLQSGSNSVLSRMNRPYTLDDFRRLMTVLREKLPGATVFTDIIVGFPGETDAEFKATRRALEEFAFNMAYVAMYSPRAGAASASLPDDVPHAVKKQRLHELTEVFKKNSLAWNQAMLGKTVRVLVEQSHPEAGFASGRTEGLIPARIQCAEALQPGTFVNATITAAEALSIEGVPA